MINLEEIVQLVIALLQRAERAEARCRELEAARPTPTERAPGRPGD